MFLQRLELTTALRPVWLSDESLLFVQDAVGLYEGCVNLGFGRACARTQCALDFVENTSNRSNLKSDIELIFSSD